MSINFQKNSNSTTINSNAFAKQSRDTVSVAFMKKTYQLLGLSMIAAALGAFLTMPFAETIQSFKLLIFGVELLILFVGFNMTRGKPALNLGMLFLFTFVTGVSLVPLLNVFIGTGNGGVIGNAFLGTSVLFGALSMFAINSKEDFSNWGKPLFITLVVVIVLSLVNMFILHSPMIHVIISAVVLLLFGLFTIYDTQNIANGAYDSEVDAAVSLYLDFLNMFTAMLSLLGMGSDD
jgi:modulator of FtsH protease